MQSRKQKTAVLLFRGTHYYNFEHILSYMKKLHIMYETKMGFLPNTQISDVLKYQNNHLTLIKILILKNRMKWQNALPKTCSSSSILVFFRNMYYKFSVTKYHFHIQLASKSYLNPVIVLGLQ